MPSEVRGLRGYICSWCAEGVLAVSAAEGWDDHIHNCIPVLLWYNGSCGVLWLLWLYKRVEMYFNITENEFTRPHDFLFVCLWQVKVAVQFCPNLLHINREVNYHSCVYIAWPCWKKVVFFHLFFYFKAVAINLPVSLWEVETKSTESTICCS